jgi:pantoate--beta-alanine ligase
MGHTGVSSGPEHTTKPATTRVWRAPGGAPTGPWKGLAPGGRGCYIQPDMSLRVIHDPDELRRATFAWRRQGETVGFVPTMGYLHEGHLSLVRLAAARCDHAVISIFVNPTQFGPGEDLDRYPRDLEGDLAKAEAAGAELAYVPEAATVYPPGYQTRVTVPDLAAPLCGASRPAHFGGVATVVTKLLNVVQPDVAVFGQKDYQQLQVVRRLVRDLDLPVEILGGPTVREPDGLAMSSRNAYLSVEDRAQAVCLVAALRQAWQRFDAGERDAAALVRAAWDVIAAHAAARIDYVELRDADTLAPVDRVADRAVLALAVFFGTTRLIDNTVLGGDRRP